MQITSFGLPLRVFLTAWLFHLLLAFDPVIALAQQADLKSRIDGLAVEIRAAPTPNADLKKSLTELRGAIAFLEAKAPDEILDPTKVAIDRATALSEALKPSDNIIKTHSKLQDAIALLFPALDSLEEVDFLKAVDRRSTSLTGLLTAAGAIPPTSLKAMKSIASLEAAILAYRKHGDPTVDIVFAEYGDLRDRNSQRKGRQLCEATAAMRKQCQGHPTCQMPASPQTALCNDDPAPYVPNMHKGVWILFRCVDSLLNVYAPPGLPSMVPSYGNMNWVPLRSSTDEFTCVPPRLNDEVKR